MGSAQVQCPIPMAGILLYKEGWLSLITTKAGAQCFGLFYPLSRILYLVSRIHLNLKP